MLLFYYFLLVVIQEFIHKQFREYGAVIYVGTRDMGGQRDIIWNLMYQSSHGDSIRRKKIKTVLLLNFISIHFPPKSFDYFVFK